VLRISSGRLWVSTGDRRAFVDTLMRPAYTITESEVLMKDENIRLGVYKAICLAVKHHDHASSKLNSLLRLLMLIFSVGAQVLIMQSIQLHEHLAEPMAEVLSVLNKEFDYPQLTEAVLRCVLVVDIRSVLIPSHLCIAKLQIEHLMRRMPKPLVRSVNSSFGSPTKFLGWYSSSSHSYQPRSTARCVLSHSECLILTCFHI
jgi:hypothetical protein